MNPYDKVYLEYSNRDKEDEARRRYAETKRQQLLADLRINVDEYLTGAKIDDRYCATLVYRPTGLLELIQRLQERLVVAVGDGFLWVYPPENVHMTILEVRTNAKKEQIETIVEKLDLYNNPLEVDEAHPVLLGNPRLNIDQSGVALTFTSIESSHIKLRSSLYNQVMERGVIPEPRYYGPSAHVTLARFIKELSEKQVLKIVCEISEMNTSVDNCRLALDHVMLSSGLNWYGYSSGQENG